MAPWRPLCHPVAGCFRVFAEDNPILGAVSGCGQAKRIRALDQGIKSGDLPDAIRVFASVELKFEADPFFVDPSSPSEAPASQKAISWPAPVTTARQKARHKFWTKGCHVLRDGRGWCSVSLQIIYGEKKADKLSLACFINNSTDNLPCC